MIKPSIPKNEMERLAALVDYCVLDTSPELPYDDLTLLASTICETPISLVSLIDQDRQWFKSRHGLDASETPRDVSFCGHAINGNDIFVVNDSLKDHRFFDNPLVTDQPTVRFYAGVPLVTPSGFPIGTLCVIDSKPKVLTEEQVKSLKALARQVIGQLELGKTNKVLKENFVELQKYSKMISEHQQLLIQNAKMASLGEMAAGVSHEINNPLTIIYGKSEQIKQLIDPNAKSSAEMRKYIDVIHKTVSRIAGIVRGLRNFSREGSKDPRENCDLSDIIFETLSIVSERFKANNIELILLPEDKISSIVPCRSTEISQILINLINNAFDAVKNLESKWVKVELQKTEKEIKILVIDSGHGIEEKIQSKIMEPFFTTKGVSVGTGLGLSISKGLAESNDAVLSYKTGQINTTFELSFNNPEKKMILDKIA
ncbi:MAG: histidine kinase dimerization/phospho-acceptor domain-containing protein [Bacteriovoracaceae bacterium]|nr:histidine kinase dimerization/phospho-acceptor domain-containing protein [Bacteriovoracaceae bacterium]